jgi:hypothetical protein
LKIVFTSLRKIASVDLEAVEGATRAAMYRAGAAVLSHLLDEQEPFPAALPCGCGHNVSFHAIRSRQLLTAVGPVTFDRAYYYCPRCHQGQVPRDRELDIVDTEYSPAVRRMTAVVGSDTSFHHGWEQLELLAGLTVTRKAVERHAEEIGADIARLPTGGNPARRATPRAASGRPPDPGVVPRDGWHRSARRRNPPVSRA